MKYIDKTDEWDFANDSPKILKISDTTFRSVANSRVDKFYYLATVYSKHEKGLEQGYLDACEMMAFMMNAGFHVYTPIAHNHTAARWINRLDHEYWLPIDFKFLSLSRGLIVCQMTNWEKSFGIAEEIKFAKELNLPVYYTPFLEIPKELV